MPEIQTFISYTPKMVVSGREQAVGEKPNPNKPAVRDSAEVLQSLSSTRGYSVIPNLFLDKLRGVLGRNSYDVFMYIVRRTLGFHKLSDAISLSQFQHGIVTNEGRRLDYGCGIKGVETIYKALKELENLGFITRQHVVAHNGAVSSNVYTICPDVILRTIEAGENGQVENKAVVASSHNPTENLTGQFEIATPEGAEQVEPITLNETNLDAIRAINPHPNESEGYSEQEEGLLSPGKDRIPALQNKNQKSITGGLDFAASVRTDGAVSRRVEIDTVLLAGLGIDAATAVKLSLLAEKAGKSDDYIAGIVKYCRQTATTSPSGMAKRLIERGEERSCVKKPLGARKSLSKTKPAFSVAASVTRTNYTTAMHLPEQGAALTTLDLLAKWETACLIVAGKMARSDLGELMRGMQPGRLESGVDGLVAYVKLKESWQARLLTPASITLIELALNQTLGQVCRLAIIS